MDIHDFIYGDFEIYDPVLVELINSKPVQRLKKISQSGIPKEFSPSPVYNRYDHSIGVMLLLQNLGAPLDEQIAGLLHDVSHTAFSHVIDTILGSTSEEDFQDSIHEKIVNNSEIPLILSKYGFDVKRIVDLERFPLLERKIPDLCADRIDYALREFYLWANPEILDLCTSNLAVYNKKIIFTSKESASAFARTFLKCQTEKWGAANDNLRAYLISKILKVALAENIINMEDLYKDDFYVMNKLKIANHNDINYLMVLLSSNLKFKIDDKEPEINLKKKFRYVDPEYLEGGYLYRLSESDLNYKKLLEEHRKINEKGIKISLLV